LQISGIIFLVWGEKGKNDLNLIENVERPEMALWHARNEDNVSATAGTWDKKKQD
jgi:hypothetical protein